MEQIEPGDRIISRINGECGLAYAVGKTVHGDGVVLFAPDTSSAMRLQFCDMRDFEILEKRKQEK